MASRLVVFSVAGGPPDVRSSADPDEATQRALQRRVTAMPLSHRVNTALLARVEQGLTAGEPPAQLVARIKAELDRQEQRRQALLTPPSASATSLNPSPLSPPTSPAPSPSSPPTSRPRTQPPLGPRP